MSTIRFTTILSRLGAILLFLLGIGGLLALIAVGYSEPWTGFGPSAASPDGTAPAKSLWDWLDLLIVPLVLALGAWLLDGSRKRSEMHVEEERQRQDTLDRYFDYMTPLLAEGKLKEGATDPVRTLARTRTLAALRLLDGNRKAQLIQFIYEAGLINQHPILSLIGANLDQADLSEAKLAGAELRGVYLRGALFGRANLRGTDLRGSDLSRADLRGAYLTKADLRQAILRNARLDRADLKDALLEQVDADGVQPKDARKMLMTGNVTTEAVNG